MKDAVIVSAARTPVGKAKRGGLATVRPDDMAATVLQELLKRTPNLDPAQVEDVVFGCAFPEGEQGLNMARMIVLRAGLPDSVPAETINRYCSSGVQSIAHAAYAIQSGQIEIAIAGGADGGRAVGDIFCEIANDIRMARGPGREGLANPIEFGGAKRVFRRGGIFLQGLLEGGDDEFVIIEDEGPAVPEDLEAVDAGVFAGGSDEGAADAVGELHAGVDLVLDLDVVQAGASLRRQVLRQAHQPAEDVEHVRRLVEEHAPGAPAPGFFVGGTACPLADWAHTWEIVPPGIAGFFG